MFMYCADGIQFLAEHNLVSEYSSLEEFKSTLKELRRNDIKFPKEIIDYAAAQWLHSPRWHREKSTFEEIKEAVKRGVTTSWWEELLNAGFDITEAEYICRLNGQLKNAFSGYFISSNCFEDLKKMFDTYGEKIFRIKNVKHLHIVINAYMVLDNPPESFNMLLDLGTIRTKFSINDDVIEMLKKYGRKKTWDYLNQGFKTVTSIKFYKKFYGLDFLWWDNEIGGTPILGSLNNIDISKIEKLSTPPEMDNSVLRALVPVYGPVKATQHVIQYNIPNSVAKFIYAKCIENPKVYYTEYHYINDMTDNKINKYFIRIPRNWESWDLIEWLINKLNNSEDTMTKDRVVHGPAGQTRTFKYIDILDEVKPEDLVNGIKTKPDKVFERSAHRIELEMKEKMGENVELPKSPWKNNKEVVQIKDSQSLKEEGKKMNNCVAGYLSACLKEKTYIFHVNKEDGCTMEVAPDGTIYQVYRPGNVPASQEQLAAVKRWTKENAKTKFTFKMTA